MPLVRGWDVLKKPLACQGKGLLRMPLASCVDVPGPLILIGILECPGFRLFLVGFQAFLGREYPEAPLAPPFLYGVVRVVLFNFLRSFFSHVEDAFESRVQAPHMVQYVYKHGLLLDFFY